MTRQMTPQMTPPLKPEKKPGISLVSQIAAVERAVAAAAARSGAEQEITRQHLAAAAETLRFIKSHEAVIRAALIGVGGGVRKP